MSHDTEPVLDRVRQWERFRAFALNPDPDEVQRLLSTGIVIGESGEDAERVEPMKRTRKRRPDFVKQVKRAMAAGLDVRSASVTADSIVMTFGESEAPADETVIETADELRKLI